MLLTGVLEPLLKKVMPAVGLAVSAVLFAVCYPVGLGWVGLGGWKLMLPQSLYMQLLYCIFGFYPDWFYSTDYFGLLPWLFFSGRGTTCTRRWAAAHGTAAPFGLPGAGLDGPALAFAVSAAPAGDLRRTFGRGSSFLHKRLDTAGKLWYSIGG